MSVTHCRYCHVEIEYPDETYSDEAPEFCSNRCSRKQFQSEMHYDEEWYFA